MVMSAIGVLETSAYIFLMSKAGTPRFSDNAAIQQLAVLKPWQIGFSILAASGLVLRRWSYSALDRFFTVKSILHVSRGISAMSMCASNSPLFLTIVLCRVM